MEEMEISRSTYFRFLDCTEKIVLQNKEFPGFEQPGIFFGGNFNEIVAFEMEKV